MQLALMLHTKKFSWLLRWEAQQHCMLALCLLHTLTVWIAPAHPIIVSIAWLKILGCQLDFYVKAICSHLACQQVSEWLVLAGNAT